MLEAEQALLGGILKKPETLVDVIDMITIDDFAKPLHRKIWETMSNAFAAGEKIDLFVVAESVKNLEYVTELATTSFGGSLEPTAKILSTQGLKRRAMINIAEAQDKVTEAKNSDDVHSAIGLIQNGLEGNTESITSTKDLIKDTMNRFDLRCKGESNGGLNTGFKSIDARLQGITDGDLVVIAGRPSMGKTAYAMNVAERISVEGGNVLVFSMEMSKEQLMDRLFASCSGVHLNLIRSGVSNQRQDIWSKLSAGLVRLKSLEKNLTIIDRPSMHVNHVLAIASKFNRTRKVDAIIIDYLQLMRADAPNRFEEVSQISRALKAMAKKLEVPVFALSQLSRKVEERSDKRPMNSDLRETGQIEQDADIIQFLYREEYYNKNTTNTGLSEVITSKFRNGEVGTDFLEQQLHMARFMDTDRVMQAEASTGYKYE